MVGGRPRQGRRLLDGARTYAVFVYALGSGKVIALRRSGVLGFSYIELVITLAIVAVALTMGYGAFEGYKQHSCARFAAQQMVEDLRYAREQALLRSSDIRISYSLDSGYDIIAIDGSTIKHNGLKEKYGKPLRMSPTSGLIVLDYRGRLKSFEAPAGTPATPHVLSFGTVPNVDRQIEILDTGFTRLLGGD